VSTQAMFDQTDLVLRDRVQDFVASLPSQLLLDMYADKVRYPKEFLEEAGRLNLLGLRFPSKYGGGDLAWMSELIALGKLGVAEGLTEPRGG